MPMHFDDDLVPGTAVPVASSAYCCFMMTLHDAFPESGLQGLHRNPKDPCLRLQKPEMAPSSSPRRQASQWQQQDVGACPCRTDSKAFVHRGELYLFGGEVRRSGLDQVRSKVPETSAIRRWRDAVGYGLALTRLARSACHADCAGHCLCLQHGMATPVC